MIKCVGSAPRSDFLKAVRIHTEGLADQDAILRLAEEVFSDGKVKGWIYKIETDTVEVLKKRISDLEEVRSHSISKAVDTLLHAPSAGLRQRQAKYATVLRREDNKES